MEIATTQYSKRIGLLPSSPTATRNTTTTVEVDSIGSSSRNISSSTSSSSRGRLVSDQYAVSKDLANELYRISEPKNFSRREAYQSILKLYHWSKTSTNNTTTTSSSSSSQTQQQQQLLLQQALQFLQVMVKLDALPYILQYIQRTATTQHHMTENKYVCTAAEILIHCTDHNDHNNGNNTTCANDENNDNDDTQQQQLQQQQQLRSKIATTKQQLTKTAIAAHCIPIVMAVIDRTLRTVTEQHCRSGGNPSLRRSQQWETLECCWTVVYTITRQCPPPPHGGQEDGPTSTTNCDVRLDESDPKISSQLLAIMDSCRTTVAMIRDTSLLIKEKEKQKIETMANKPQGQHNDTIITTAIAVSTTTQLQSLLMDSILRLVLHTSKNIARMNHNNNQHKININSLNSILLMMANDLEEDCT